MKNNVLIVILVILIGVLSGVALLIGVNTAVQIAVAPVNARLTQIETLQKVILQKMGTSSSDNQAPQLTSIENQLKAIQGKLANLPNFAAPPPGPPPEDFNKVYTIDVGNSPVNGKKEAPITITEFTDLQCPFCARFYPPLKEVLKAYPDQVKVVVKNFPLSFHPNARPAAKLALAANEQGKYYEMVDLLLQNGADVSEAKVKDYAKQLNLNYDKLMSDVKSKDLEYEKRINDDLALGDQVEVQGTPTFFINGKKTNARDVAAYKAEIDKILAAK
jgi:protein-disulfide isomerase